MDLQLAIIGGGSIGEALVAGVTRSKQYPPNKIIVSEPLKTRREHLLEQFSVNVTADNSLAVQRAEIVVMAVKPQFYFSSLSPMVESLTEEHLLISVAAGIGTGEIEGFLKKEIPIIRVMTNTPLLIGQGATVLARGKYAVDKHLAKAKKLFLDLGLAIELAENDLNAVTALSGSGPAYLYLILEALIEAGVRIGLTRELSRQLMLQTMLGSAKMILETGKHPAELKESVTSPGGTTAAALEHLEAKGIRGALIQAVVKAYERAEELSLMRE
ncbi:MAG: pyrroline-5-carboxylate reductase [Bacillota bacterium]